MDELGDGLQPLVVSVVVRNWHTGDLYRDFVLDASSGIRETGGMYRRSDRMATSHGWLVSTDVDCR